MKKALFIGQAPARPSSKHEVPGTYLHTWLRSIGVTDFEITNNCHFYALTNIFPGSGKNGHLPPTRDQIDTHLPALQKIIATIQPDIIVPVGKLAIAELLQQKSPKLTDVVGKKYVLDPFNALGQKITCLPLSHPSGRSTWNALHKDLVALALAQLKQELYN